MLTRRNKVIFDLHKTPTDDLGYIESVRSIVQGAVDWCEPQEVYLTKIDHWFGDRWLRFTGKTLGAIGVWRNKLTIPPFVPSRVLDQRHLEHDLETGDYRADKASGVYLHQWQPSSKNFQRHVDQ